jgi:hypothetical protein
LEAELFVAVLGASSFLHAEAVLFQGLKHWIGAHVHALEAIGCVPRVVVCDNLRSGVTRAHRYEPDVNATYEEMAAYYGMAVIPTSHASLGREAKVDAGRSSPSAGSWPGSATGASTHWPRPTRRSLSAWTPSTSARELPGSPRSWFEELERPVMRPLPEARYEFARWRVG